MLPVTNDMMAEISALQWLTPDQLKVQYAEYLKDAQGCQRIEILRSLVIYRLQELLKDVNEGKIDVVVVYKLDRISRSLRDFTELDGIFSRHGASMVSVTQQIDTSSSMGRMIVNLLMSFAQFEREMTSDRVWDKMAASRKKEIWTGGVIPYGYKSIVCSAQGAAQVRLLRVRDDSDLQRQEGAGVGDVPLLPLQQHAQALHRGVSAQEYLRRGHRGADLQPGREAHHERVFPQPRVRHGGGGGAAEAGGEQGQPYQDDDPRGTAAAGADLHPGGEGAQGRHRPRGARGRFQEADGKGIGNANPTTRRRCLPHSHRLRPAVGRGA